MRNVLIIIAALWALSVSAFADEAPAEQPSSAAMAFVGQFSDDHLSGMLSAVGARQSTMVGLSQLNGQLLAVVFDAEIDKAVAAYGHDWQTNMALAWTGLMSDDEFMSLVLEGADSPYTQKYEGLRSTAGQEMQARSGDLFRELLAKVIHNTVTEIGTEADSAKQ